MAGRLRDSAWPYFAAAGLLIAVAIGSQFELVVPSRPEASVDDLASLRDRDDLNVVFLLVDTLRADRLGLYGYERPTSKILDELASVGIVFENAFSQSSWTKTSMASLWTGTHPVNNGILRYNHVIPDEATLPAELFKEAGFRTVGVYRNGWVEPNFGFDQGFDVYVRPMPGRERARIHRKTPSPSPLTGTDEDLTVSAKDFIQRFGHERFFLYLHYMDVHQYVYDEQASIFGTSYSDAYDQAIHWTDRLIGELLLQLDEADLLSKTLIVISSDHGEAFLEHGSEGHAKNLYAEVTRVPFILLPPFLLRPGIRVEQAVSNADVWPTVLDLVGLPPLPGADGRSLVPEILAAAGQEGMQASVDGGKPVFSQIDRRWGTPRAKPVPVVSVIHEGQRAHIWFGEEEVNRVEVYDRAADPQELSDLADSDPESAEALLELVQGYRDAAEAPWGEAPPEIELDEMRLNHLRALGYVIKQ